MRLEPPVRQVRQIKRPARAVLLSLAALLCLPVTSALASSTDVRCGRSVGLDSSLDVPKLHVVRGQGEVLDRILDNMGPDKMGPDNMGRDNVHRQLSTAIVDHVTSNTLPSDDTDLNAQRATISSKSSPRVKAILQQIFDKPTFDKSTFDQSVSSSESATELAGPALTIRTDAMDLEATRDGETSTDFQRPAVDVAGADPASASPERGNDSGADVNAHLPGISEDESSRYRHEMYRTDI